MTIIKIELLDRDDSGVTFSLDVVDGESTPTGNFRVQHDVPILLNLEKCMHSGSFDQQSQVQEQQIAAEN